MLMALLLLTWMWDRVVTDCDGQNEIVRYYQFQATIRTMGTGSCPTGQGKKTTPCIAVVPAPPRPFGVFLDPGSGTTVSTNVDPIRFPQILPTPPLGGVAAWPWPTEENPIPIVAVDWGGNKSGGNNCR